METNMEVSQVAWHRRAGYALLHLSLLLAVEHRLLTDSASGTTDTDWALLVFAALATAVFYFLQGSDPGFLTEDLLRARVKTNGTGSEVVIQSEKLLGEGSDDSSRELEYQRERIRQIQTALQKAQKEEGKSVEEVAEGIVEIELNEGDSACEVSKCANPSDMTDFCADCALQPPLRAHHCSFCGKCVAKFDHHCILLATCIGEKNHCRFWWYLLLQTVEIAIAIDIASTGSEASHSSSRLQANGGLIVLLVVLWVLFLFAFGLWCFHTFLAIANLTTWEFGHGSDTLPYLRGFSDCDLPFSRGVMRNLQSFGCYPNVKCVNSQCARSSWTPQHWELPDHIERDSTLISQNLWENKYYSCC